MCGDNLELFLQIQMRTTCDRTPDFPVIVLSKCILECC